MIELVGKKIGMTQVFDDSGVLTPVTVIEVEDSVVVGERTPKRDGYRACILGAIDLKASQVTKPYAGQFKGETEPKKYLYEIRDLESEFEVGMKVGIESLNGSGYVDVTGVSKGKGYQGVMKRHGYGGGRRSHGSKFHRAPGSTGMAAWPSKVLKGTKMPGRMGAEQTTMQNLPVVSIDEENSLLLVAGSIPGRRNGIVFVKSAKKKGQI